MESVRIIFMGTAGFAIPSLKALAESGHKVVAVVTAMDKPQGRGQKMQMSPVKEFAIDAEIPVLQPPNLKAPDFLEILKSYHADLHVVVAFRMLPEVVWNMPPLGTINLHASLLPQYRGAAPINWAIINGEKETGVTTFFLNHSIDTGNIIFQENEAIRDDDDAGSLHDRLMAKGAGLVLKSVNAIASGTAPRQPQREHSQLQHAPKIFKETCSISWAKTSSQLINFVRGLSPYPAAWTKIAEKVFKIYRISMANFEQHGEPGQFATDNKNYLYFRTSDGWISIDELQPEGKKRMTINEFFRGNKIVHQTEI